MDRMTAETLPSEGAVAARRKVEQFVTGVKDQATRLKSKSFEDIWTGSVNYVKDNPGKTIVVSLALGLVMGTLLRRRGD